jgi:hypothetical protein
VRFPPPVDAELFTTRGHGAAYLGAWTLTATHLVLWLLVAIGVLTGLAITIGLSVLSFLATCLLVGMVIVVQRRLELHRGASTRRQVLSAWWRGPWDPVGRQIWLPVRFGAAWRAVRRPPSPGAAATSAGGGSPVAGGE